MFALFFSICFSVSHIQYNFKLGDRSLELPVSCAGEGTGRELDAPHAASPLLSGSSDRQLPTGAGAPQPTWESVFPCPAAPGASPSLHSPALWGKTHRQDKAPWWGQDRDAAEAMAPSETPGQQLLPFPEGDQR